MKKRRENGFLQKVKSFFSKFKKVIKYEKEKKEAKKRPKNKSVKPKGFLARKVGVIVFWVTFGFMFLIVVVTFFSDGSDEANADEYNHLKEQNQATSPEAIQFAENFAKDYFTWTVSDEGKHERKEKMSKYLAQGINEYAGLDFGSLEWNSSFKGSEVKKVQEKGDNLAHITLLVEMNISKSDEDEVNKTEKYFVVPVAYDGKTYGIYELPKFTYVQEQTTLKQVTSERLKKAELADSRNIKDFLPTFFKSYAEDSKDKLNYIIANEDITDGLNETMLFKSINKADIYMKNDEDDNTFVVFTEVTFTEPETNIPFVSNYQLSVIKKDGRYIVSGIDDQENKVVEPMDDSESIKQQREEVNENDESIKEETSKDDSDK